MMFDPPDVCDVVGLYQIDAAVGQGAKRGYGYCCQASDDARGI